MLNETGMEKLRKLNVIEYIGNDEAPNLYYLVEHKGKKAILHIDWNLPAGLHLFFTPFVYGVDNYSPDDDIDEEDLETKEVYNAEEEAIDYDEHLKELGAEKLTSDNYEFYCKEQVILDEELGDYSLNFKEHDEVVKLLSLDKFNPKAYLNSEED